ncbi:unnamed protein product [Lactuca virosa]|uniref:Uncharacterized protein n=1 Tax=Lactuca virosa TaxID=75947 RepID=A0AAU9MQ95_9ASTR|nr:unnamed protein product [Lactuca virosa]
MLSLYFLQIWLFTTSLRRSPPPSASTPPTIRNYVHLSIFSGEENGAEPQTESELADVYAISALKVSDALEVNYQMLIWMHSMNNYKVNRNKVLSKRSKVYIHILMSPYEDHEDAKKIVPTSPIGQTSVHLDSFDVTHMHSLGKPLELVTPFRQRKRQVFSTLKF